MDSRIGQLNGGKYYAYINGYDQEPLFGSLAEVEAALGIQASIKTEIVTSTLLTYTVTLRYEYPAWDEVNGINYSGIEAKCKSDAIKAARKKAETYGHCQTGKGRYWFTAEVEH
ncbi:hypothetical protein [Rheinheimera sp.]|uniref:hypothetical protein n=1 Tax=Rheinheimera sp. TaxID=1869214 RepID=UPI004047A9D3